MHFQRLVDRGKSRRVDLKLIKPEGQALHVKRPVTAGREGVRISIGFAGDLNWRLHASAGRIDEFDVKLADCLSKTGN